MSHTAGIQQCHCRNIQVNRDRYLFPGSIICGAAREACSAIFRIEAVQARVMAGQAEVICGIDIIVGRA